MSLLISCSDCSGAENCPLQEGGGWKEAQVELQGESLTLLESESFQIVWKWKVFALMESFALFESGSFCIVEKWKWELWYSWKVNVFKLWIRTSFEKKNDFFYNNGNEKFYARRLRTRCSPGQQSRGTRMAHSCPHKIPASPSHQRSKSVVYTFSLNHIFGSTNFRVFTHLLLGNGQVWWWAPLVLVMGDITGRNIQEIVARFPFQNVHKIMEFHR